MTLRHLKHTVATMVLVLTCMLVGHQSVFAQSNQMAANQSEPPSIMFMVAIAGVFVGITVLFVVFARSQGCDTSEDKNQQWQ
jgi:heme/copper-type cytochrome/quinol oxidase subunit 2